MNFKMEEQKIIVEYEWDLIVERLAYHRKRLGVEKEEMQKWIKQKYGKTFWKLSDAEIFDLGLVLAYCRNKTDLI